MNSLELLNNLIGAGRPRPKANFEPTPRPLKLGRSPYKGISENTKTPKSARSKSRSKSRSRSPPIQNLSRDIKAPKKGKVADSPPQGVPVTESDDENISTDDVKKINEIIDLLNESDLNENEIDISVNLIDIDDINEIDLDKDNLLDIFDTEINNITDENAEDYFAYDDTENNEEDEDL